MTGRELVVVSSEQPAAAAEDEGTTVVFDPEAAVAPVIARLVREMPPLSDDVRHRLARLLGGGAA